MQNHTLIIVKALYGLRTSGLRWHEKLADCLRNEGFLPCKVEPDIWMRDKGDHYEYVGVYVDDLVFAMKDPSSFIKTLESKYFSNSKGLVSYPFTLDATSTEIRTVYYACLPLSTSKGCPTTTCECSVRDPSRQ
jgi:hypothetical protein